MWDYTKLVVLGVIAVLAAIATNYAHDLAYQVNALVVMLAAGLTFMWTLRTMDEPKRATPNEYMDGVVRAGVIATTFWGVVGFLVGVWIAFQLAFPALNFEWAQGDSELWPVAAAAHQRGDLCLWRQCADHVVASTSCSAPARCGCGAATWPGSCSGAGS